MTTSLGVPSGEPATARPLPAPPLAGRASKGAPGTDHLSLALEEWLVEVKLRYTLGGD